MSVDFESIKHTLRPCIESIVKNLYPSGKKIGTEFKVGSIYGEPGDSMSINLETGVWKDFAEDGIGGSDIIALYATLKDLSMIEAAKRLVESYAPEGIRYLNGHAGKKSESVNRHVTKTVNVPVTKSDTLKNTESQFILAPLSIKLPNLNHAKYGEPSSIYKYQNQEALFGLVVRYDLPDSKKEFRPWSMTIDEEWVPRAWKQNSPLYAQERWQSTEKFIVTEGEKCVDALYNLFPKLSITTWQGGVNGLERADLTPLFTAQKVVLWPDNDEPGIKCMNKLAAKIYAANPKCEILILNTKDKPAKWDAADFIEEGGTAEAFKEMVLNSKKWEPIKEPEVVNNKPLRAEVIPGSIYDIWVNVGVQIDDKQKPQINEATVTNILSLWEAKNFSIWYDTFLMDYMIQFNGEKPRKLDHDFDPTNFLIRIQTELQLYKLKESTVYKSMLAYALKNKRNILTEWLDSLIWDGEQRVDSFFPDYMGTQDSDYTRAVSRNFWVSMMARAYQPGCKVDNMVILEGDQGITKSTILSIIGGDYFKEADSDIHQKEFYMSMRGALLLEISELKSIRKSDAAELKKVITTQIDNYRAPYERQVKPQPRQCIFVGTTNESEYLKDATGNRRFWPLKINNPNTEKIKEDREQLFAEAVYLFKNGATWWDMPESTKEEQESRVESDPWEYEILKFIEEKTSKEFTMVELAKSVLGLTEVLRLDAKTVARMSFILKKHKYITSQKKIHGKKYNVWSKVPEQKQISLTSRHGLEPDAIY